MQEQEGVFTLPLYFLNFEPLDYSKHSLIVLKSYQQSFLALPLGMHTQEQRPLSDPGLPPGSAPGLLTGFPFTVWGWLGW